jgi:DNA-binding beta-propeller fold protein YncE
VTSIANNATQLLRLDPRTNAVIATIDIGAIPQPSQEVLDPTIQVATSGDSVWVARQTSAGNDIARIDPATNQLVDSIPIDIRPQGLVADGGTLWVASNWDNTVVRVDPTTRQTVARIDVAAPGAIAFGSGSVWVTSEESGDLLRIDPATNALSATIPIGIGTADPDYEAPNGYFAEPFSVAAGEDSVWVADVLGDTLMRVDPATNQVVATLDLRAPGAVAVTDDAVYVCRTDIGQVEQIDPASNQIVAASEGTPRIFASIGVGFDAIWITGSIGVTRIDVGP